MMHSKYDHKYDTICAVRALIKNQNTVEVIEEYISDSDELILILKSIPWNRSSHYNLVKILSFFTDSREIILVGTEAGAENVVDTLWLKNLYTDDKHKEMINTLLDRLQLSPAEYCSVISYPFVLWGVDNRELYDKQYEIWLEIVPYLIYLKETGNIFNIPPEYEAALVKYEEFEKLDYERAEAIVENLLKKMRSMKCLASIIICCGHLPEYVSHLLKNKNISYFRLEPTSDSADDLETYLNLLRKQREHKTVGEIKKIKKTPFSQVAYVFYKLYLSFKNRLFRLNCIRQKFYKINPKALESFMNAGSITEALQLLERHPELLGNETMEMITAMERMGREKQKEVPGAYRFFKIKRYLLEECRRRGLKTVVKEQSIYPDPRNIDNPGKKFADFVATKTWSRSRSILEDNRFMLGLEFLFGLEIINEEKTDLSLIHHTGIIRKCRDDGIAHTFIELIEHFGDRKPDAGKILTMYLFAKTKKELKQILNLCPFLYSDQFLNNISGTITNLTDKLTDLNGFNLKNVLKKRMELLVNCGKEGVTAALLNYSEE